MAGIRNMMLISMIKAMVCLGPKLNKLQKPVFPSQIVAAAELAATQLGVDPMSLLLVDVGRTLSSGSFRLESSLLLLGSPSLPLGRGPPTHTGLSEALAAPQSIVLLTTRREYAENTRFYQSDSTQNVRHKFLFLIVVDPSSDQRETRFLRMFFSVRTLIVSGHNTGNFLCVKNHDNLFYEASEQPISDCGISIGTCKAEHMSDTIDTPLALLRMTLKLRCNSTLATVALSADKVFARLDPVGFQLKARWVLHETDDSQCFTYIPSVSADVTALLEAFKPETWCLILLVLCGLAAAWSVMARTSGSVIFCELVLMIVTSRGVDSPPRSYPILMIGCTALAFSFLVGHIYSNDVMSSFLSPAGHPPSPDLIYDCGNGRICQDAGVVSRFLEFGPVCSVNRKLRFKIEKPLQRYQRPRQTQNNLSNRQSLNLENLHSGSPSTFQTIYPLPLVSAHPGKILERILQSAIASYQRMKVLEMRAIDGAKQTKLAVLNRIEWLAFKAALKRIETRSPMFERFVTYNMTREWFDLDAFVKIQPLIALCCVFALAGFCHEVCQPWTSWLLNRVRGVLDNSRRELSEWMRSIHIPAMRLRLKGIEVWGLRRA